MSCNWCKRDVENESYYECQEGEQSIVICDKCWEQFFFWLLQKIEERNEIQYLLR